MAQRIKGQEIFVTLMKDGAQVAALNDIRNFTLTPNFDKKEEGYLGETNNRYDEIFKGVSFEFEAHVEQAAFIDFMQAIKERAARRTPGTVINIFATLNFPGGDRARIVMRDCFFADMPFSVGSRSDYASVKFSGSAGDFEKIS